LGQYSCQFIFETAVSLSTRKGLSEMPTGNVKWFNSEKGYGFIKPEDGSPDVFVHISAVERSGLSDLHDGQKVGYQVEQNRKTGKWTAVDLLIL
jgi:CspA family cold shock protein